MSLEAWEFDNEDSQTAFFGGVISALTDVFADRLSKSFKDIMLYHADIVADIYNVANMSILDSIKKRMTENWFGGNLSQEKITDLLTGNPIKLSEVKNCTTMQEAIIKYLLGFEIKSEREKETLWQIVDEYASEIKWYLGEDFKSVQIITGDYELISYTYTWITFSAIAIVMGNYCIVMFYGSNE